MNTDKIYAESLVNEYAPKDTSKVVALKKLDQKAKLPATIITYTLGMSASLIIGIGMCLSMGIIGDGTTFIKGLGICIGVVGIILVGINYPLYKKVLKTSKEKYAYEIVELAKEIASKKLEVIRLNKSESKYFNTAMRMDKAFLELIEIKDFEYMTIKEICQKAEVNRSTFYLHYENMNDLLIESVEYMHRQFQSYFNEQVFDIESLSIQELIFITPEYLVPYLTFIKDNRRLFQTVIQKGMTFNVNETYEKMFQHIFNPIMNKMNFPMNERHYILSFYIHGIIAIVNKWIQNDCLDSIEDIVNTIIKCVHSFHSYHAIK